MDLKTFRCQIAEKGEYSCGTKMSLHRLSNCKRTHLYSGAIWWSPPDQTNLESEIVGQPLIYRKYRGKHSSTYVTMLAKLIILHNKLYETINNKYFSST